MSIEVIFETHSTSTDNEAGIASGSRDVGLSHTGRRQAAELGERRRGDVHAVFCSDLLRATQTAEIAFGDTVAVTADPRLREQDYGELTGERSSLIEGLRPDTVDAPFPGGESLIQAVERISAFLHDLKQNGHDGSRVLVIGHRATKLALDHLLGGVPLDEAATAMYTWQPGWEYVLP